MSKIKIDKLTQSFFALRLDLEGRDIDLRQQVSCLLPKLSRLPPGATVASVSNDRLFNFMLLLMLPRLGLRFMPLNPDLPQGLREHLLHLGNASLVVGDVDDFPQGDGEVVCFPNTLPPDSAWLLLATSGTTGEPRLVELSGRNLYSSVLAVNRLLGFGEQDRWLACLPMFHIGGLAIPLRAHVAGGAVSLTRTFQPDQVLERIKKGDITHVSLVPTMLVQLLQTDPGFRPPSSLRAVLLGGAPATATVVNEGLKRGWPLCPSYGMTETASQVSTLCPPPSDWVQGLVGRPLPHLEVKIGAGGEVMVRGEAVAAQSRSRHGTRKLLQTGGWLETRDLGHLDEEGRLWVLGRKDDLLLTGGEKVHPEAVEAELRQIPGVEGVGVTAVPDPRWGEALVALYTGSVSSEDLLQMARARLQHAYLPKYFFRVPSLPFSEMGKLLRKDLATLASRLCLESMSY